MLALLFPGQGSQRPGMGQPWVGTSSWGLVDQLSDATGWDVGALLTSADADQLKATRNSQIATFTLSLVILDAARQSGAAGRVTAVAGHSLGEYTALVAAGVLSPEDGGRLVKERGEAMQAAADANPGTMAAILGLDPDSVLKASASVDGAWVANDNAPGQIVIAGTKAGVDSVSQRAKQVGAKRVLPLPVGGAFHSPLMAPAQARLDAALADADFATPKMPVVANVDAHTHDDAASWPQLLSSQLCQPVRWRETLLQLSGLGVSTFVELGPGTELSGMVKRTVEGAIRANVATPDDLPNAVALVDDAR
ncbi:MAG TPA: ACP S-malonyltransferase [Acidimicrobiales bacterium]|nr:ACP S-malonyltransferase [Acidimicrobiales bacterium]